MTISRAQLVIPMAGEGKRFLSSGYETPKPLLPIHGVPMYQVVIANLLDSSIDRVVLIARQEWSLDDHVKDLARKSGLVLHLVSVESTTRGSAESVELASPYLDRDLPVVVANSDQYIDARLDEFWSSTLAAGNGGTILTMHDSDPKWSYAEVDNGGKVRRVVEKEVISRHATVGIYGFGTGHLMLDAIHEMKARGDMTNGEYYLAPAFNHAIRSGASVGIVDLGPIGGIMHGLGIPEDYERFMRAEVSLRAAAAGRALSR